MVYIRTQDDQLCCALFKIYVIYFRAPFAFRTALILNSSEIVVHITTMTSDGYGRFFLVAHP